jgi:hypothetical protein
VYSKISGPVSTSVQDRVVTAEGVSTYQGFGPPLCIYSLALIIMSLAHLTQAIYQSPSPLRVCSVILNLYGLEGIVMD